MSKATAFAPDGVRLLFSRALAADIEVRLSVVWPPTTGRPLMASDFPEPVGGGYRRQRVAAGTWVTGTRDGEVRAEAPMQVFRFTGPMDNSTQVVAHVFVDATSGQFLWADRYQDPVPVRGPGELEVFPVLRLRPPAEVVG